MYWNKLSPVKLLRAYDVGNITEHELLFMMEQAATRTPPEEIATLLPASLLDELRERAQTPPGSLDNCRVYWMGATEAQMREEAQLLFDGRWRWHQYFHKESESSNG